MQMKSNFWSKRIGAASLATTLLFTGNALVAQSTATEEVPLAVVESTESPQPSCLPTTTPAPSPKTLACAQIAEEADGRHIFVYDARASEMIYCNTAPLDKLYPASITKVYAAWVALMYLESEAVVTAGDELRLIPSDSSRAFISKGCRLTVQMLVEAMLLPSGSDASYVLAAAAGRTIAEDKDLTPKQAVDIFLEEMNRQATVLELQNSHFMNPDGYHDEDHYMCPNDVAIIAALALENPVIAKYASLQQDAVQFESGEHITWYNHNQLIAPGSSYYSPQATGMKTGYTDQAGHCLLASFQQDQNTLIVGIFGSQQRYPRFETANQLFTACS